MRISGQGPRDRALLSPSRISSGVLTIWNSGVAVGSTIGHTLGGFFGGGSSAAPPADAEQVQTQSSQYTTQESAVCAGEIGSFRKCMDQNQVRIRWGDGSTKDARLIRSGRAI